MSEIIQIILALGGVAAGFGLGYVALKSRKGMDAAAYRQKAEALVEKSQQEAQSVKTSNIKRLEEIQAYMRDFEAKNKLQCEKLEKLVLSKEEQFTAKNAKNEEIKKQVDEENQRAEELRQNMKLLDKAFLQKLLTRTGKSYDDARDEVMGELMRDLELEREDKIRKYEEYLKEEKVRIAKDLLTSVIQRYSAPTSVDKKNTDIEVARDEAKGKVLGRNAQNILLLEELTGTDIIFNDSPNTIIVSCFDLVRKNIARETILRLLKERAVTADKVREKYQEAKLETERTLIRIGRETVRLLGMESRNFPEEFMRTVGRLKFRTSYGQNILKHSYEVGYFTMMLGGELNLDMTVCKSGGFFHDIGKAIDQEVGGAHDALTKEIMEKYGFSPGEIHAAWAHHDAVPQETAEALLVKAGDAISAGRPGARQESIEKYIERIQAIERISSSYEGVSKTFAISAGREVRVMVDPMQMKDVQLLPLAKSIASDIQANVAYPGKIKVNVIRRTKNVDYAKKEF
jgi:ribonuclease Y